MQVHIATDTSEHSKKKEQLQDYDFVIFRNFIDYIFKLIFLKKVTRRKEKEYKREL